MLIWDLNYNPLTAANQILDKIVRRIYMFVNLFVMTSVSHQSGTSLHITDLQISNIDDFTFLCFKATGFNQFMSSAFLIPDNYFPSWQTILWNDLPECDRSREI